VAASAVAQELDEAFVDGEALAGEGGLRGDLVRGDDEVGLVRKASRRRKGCTDSAGDTSGPILLGGAGPGDRLAQCLEGAALGGADAVELVVEESVDRGARYTCASGDLSYRQRRVTLLGEDRAGRAEKALALVGEHLLPGYPVAPADDRATSPQSLSARGSTASSPSLSRFSCQMSPTLRCWWSAVRFSSSQGFCAGRFAA
jgi:hypothetical protein